MPRTKGTKPTTKKVKTVSKHTVVKRGPRKQQTAVHQIKQKPEKKRSCDVFTTSGMKSGTMKLPEYFFHGKVNTRLMAQAVRVYLANQREGGASTKTRGEVEGSTRKIYRQKGTGRARHGGIRAPLFVGGGIVFGPRPKDFRLKFPKNMCRRALISALTYQHSNNAVKIVEGITSLKTKTKEIAGMLKALGIRGSVLYVLPRMDPALVRIARNINTITIVPVLFLTTCDVLTHQTILMPKETVEIMTEQSKKEKL